MNETTRILLIKYITGNADETEQQLVREWIAESEDNLEEYITLKETWQDALHHPDHPAVNTKAAFQQLREKLQIDPPAPGIPKHRPWLTGTRAAIIGGLIIATGATLITLKNHRTTQSTALADNQLFVPPGKMKTVLLPDSTEVWLNAGSHFSYTPDYGQTNREVTLEGEGYFVVHHNDKIPFRVKAGHYTIRDVGTTFTIRYYPGNKNFETAVMEGEVYVTSDFSPTHEHEGIHLSKNEVLKLPQNLSVEPTNIQKTAPATTSAPPDKFGVRILEGSKMEGYSGWKDHLLVFDEETFDEVAGRLARTFGVKIKITSEQLAALRYTGRFNKVPTIEAALEIIKETTPIRYKVEKDSIIISPGPKN